MTQIKILAERVCAKEDLVQWDYDMVEVHPDPTIYRAENRLKFESTVCVRDEYTYFSLVLEGGQSKLYAPSKPPTAATPPPPPPTAPRVPDPPNIWAPKPRVPVGAEWELYKLVLAACKDPGGFRNSALPDLSWFPAAGHLLSIGSRREGMGVCEGQLWDYLADKSAAGRSLDLDDVSQRAWGYQPGSQPQPAPRGTMPECMQPGNNCVRGLPRLRP